MAYLLLRVLVNALSIAVIVRVLDAGIHVANNDIGTYILIGVVFGIVNALVKPIITLLTCSLVIFTLGLFILVINGLMLSLTAALLGDLFVIDSFGWAVLGGIIISIINMLLELAIGRNNNDSQIEVYRVE